MTTVKMERKALVQALRVLGAVAPKKTTIPALNTVKLSANGDVKLAATDLEYGAVASIDRIGGKGDVTLALPVARLMPMIRAGVSELVSLTTGPDFTVTVDGAAKIMGIDPNDLPAVPDLDDGELVAKIDAAALAEGFHNVDHSVSSEVVRYALTGVLLDLGTKPRKANMVSSDGKRLMRWALPGATVRKDTRIIVPCKALKTLAALAGKSGGKAELFMHNGNVTKATFRVGDSGVFTRLIEGHFPDYEAVTPALLGAPWTINREALICGLVDMAPVLTDKTMAVRFTFAPGKLTLFARTQGVGEATRTMACSGRGEAAELVLNPDYVRDYLLALPKGIEQVTVQVRDKKTAALWQSTDHDKYVVMPLTINL